MERLSTKAVRLAVVASAGDGRMRRGSSKERSSA
jgi:hypothetical protein